MGLLELVLVIALVGALVYFITTVIPMPEPFRTAIYVLVAIVLAIYLVRVIGFDIPIPRRA